MTYKKLFGLFQAITVTIFLFGITGGYKINHAKDIPDESQLTLKQREWVSGKLRTMTLREKIAQMVISNTLGEDYDENSSEYKRLAKLCRDDKIGGFIFFKGTAGGYAGLSNKLQSFSETPLLLSA